MGNYTIKVSDQYNLLPPEIESLISKDAEYVCKLIGRYINWKGVLDLEVRILPNEHLTWSDADGLLPAIGDISWNGSGWTNNTRNEALSGIDSDSSAPDIGCSMFLGEDGTPRNYGMPLWFDPNPVFDQMPNIPSGHADFIGI